MKKRHGGAFSSCLLVALALVAHARAVDVTAYGAKADGATDNTAPIQRAIDACSASDGGRAVLPGGGVYKTCTPALTNNVQWTHLPNDLPEWYLTLEQEGAARRVRVAGSAQEGVETDARMPDVRRWRYPRLTDGVKSWDIAVEIEARATPAGGTAYCGRVANADKGVRVTGFEGPYFEAVYAPRPKAALCYARGLGDREAHFPAADDARVRPLPREEPGTNQGWGSVTWYRLPDGRFTFDTGFYPGVTGLTMPWAALETGEATWYVGAHERAANPKRLRLRWNARTCRAEAAFDHRFFLVAGARHEIPETVCEPVAGDWRAAAKRYRAWYDTTHELRAATPAWTREIAGWLLVIMRQQNEQIYWRYTDLPQLCDVAAAHGLDCLGLFGWTQGGHDHLYPDYTPSDEMGGVAALRAGIAEAHRRGMRVYIYANGQLQQVGATTFWKEHGERLALVRRDGTRVIQNYHKFADTPKYDFALGCLYGQAWYERMYALAEQAEGFGADGILYDQLGVFAPFACYGKAHGHPVPHYSYAAERPGFIRRIADAIQRKNPRFAVLTEGLHDTILDSIGLFHGCEYGTFAWHACALRRRAQGVRHGAFPELFRYTFPELVTSLRVPAPVIPRTSANYAATFGFRHDLEVRYAPDRAYVLADKVPVKADYGTAQGIPDLGMVAAEKPVSARAYLKAVCVFQRAHAKYLLAGAFADADGFACADPALIAKRFVAADSTSAVCVWNVGAKPAAVKLDGLGAPTAVHAPAGEPTQGPLAPDAIRLYVFAR